VQEGEYGRNITQSCMKEMRPVETIPGMAGEGVKKNDGGGEFTCDIYDTL
jgi:hypothetical protein